MIDVAIGLRDHSGWAVAVVVSAEPRVLDRRRLTLCPDDLPRQVYHAAAGEPPDTAARLVAEVEAAATTAAAAEVAALVGELRAAGHRVRGAALAADTVAVPAELAAILASHPMLHAAEGELYREALAEALRVSGVPVIRHTRGELRPGDAADLGRGLGPPWARDQKEAAAAALLALQV
ncbi:MAG TPA: hypothetical protein VGD67_23725 [Pseudonocardiaceae bacterium]